MFFLKKFLPFFSYLFHPIFIPIFGSFFYFIYNPTFLDLYQKLFVLLQIAVLTIFIPICFFFILRFWGKIDTIMVSDVAQRKTPLLFQLFLFLTLILRTVPITFIPELYFFFLSGLISTAMAFLFLFLNIKASIHMIGMISLTFFVIGLSIHNQINAVFLIAILFFLTGLVGSSRLELKAHTIKELFFGFLLGIVPQVVLWFFWL